MGGESLLTLLAIHVYMYVCIFDTRIYQSNLCENRCGSPLASGSWGFANLNLESAAPGPATAPRAARGAWSRSSLEIESQEGRVRAAAARRLLAGNDSRGGGAGHAPAAVAAAPRTRRRPRLLALFQASPSSSPCYKRRDRGAGASLRQLPAG